MNRSIWIRPGINENPIQMVSAQIFVFSRLGASISASRRKFPNKKKVKI